MRIRETKTNTIVDCYDIANDKDVKSILAEHGDDLEALAYTGDKDLILLGSCGHWYAPPWGKYVVEV